MASSTNTVNDLTPSEKEDMQYMLVLAGEIKDIMALSDAERLKRSKTMKHPLEYGWTFYYFKSDHSTNWNNNNLRICTVHNVEDFWSLHNHVALASKLCVQCDYSFFKEGIKPEWEDKCNSLGGKWTLKLDKQKRSTNLDKIWMDSVLCVIGESFEDVNSHICGVVVNIRHRGDKICLWTGHAADEAATMKIGRIFRDYIKVPTNVKITYQAHADCISHKGSLAKNLYSL